MKNKHKPRDGYYPEHIAEDGEEIFHPLFLADGYRRDLVQSFGAVPDLSLHQSGYRVADEATRDKVRAARQEMIDRATSGWRKDIRPPDDDPDDPDPDEDDLNRERDRRSRSSDARDPRAAARAAYDAMVRRAENAWRTPPNAKQLRDAADPGNSELIRRHLRTEEDDPQARRDEAYRNYCASISQAWKNPSGGIAPQKALVGPGTTSHIERAGEIERLGEQTRGGR
jgi:hypothetical protein